MLRRKSLDLRPRKWERPHVGRSSIVARAMRRLFPTGVVVVLQNLVFSDTRRTVREKLANGRQKDADPVRPDAAPSAPQATPGQVADDPQGTEAADMRKPKPTERPAEAEQTADFFESAEREASWTVGERAPSKARSAERSQKSEEEVAKDEEELDRDVEAVLETLRD